MLSTGAFVDGLEKVVSSGGVIFFAAAVNNVVHSLLGLTILTL